MTTTTETDITISIQRRRKHPRQTGRDRSEQVVAIRRNHRSQSPECADNLGNNSTVVSVNGSVTGSATALAATMSASTNLFATLDNSGAGNSVFRALVEGAGDPKTLYEINGVQSWATGIDNSDSDSFKISGSSSLGTSDALTITSGLNVGIGDSSPAALLTVGSGDLFQVDSAGRISTGGAQVGNQPLSLNIASDGYGIVLGDRSANGTMYVGRTASGSFGNSGWIGFGGDGTASNNWLDFSGYGSTPQVRITKDGNVGIGTTTPNAPLTVSGGGSGIASVLGDTTGVFQKTSSAGNNSRLAIISGSAGQSILDFGQSSNQGLAGLVYDNSGSTLRINVGNEAMRINSSGSVGIGTTSPYRALSVVGTAAFNASSINLDNTTGTQFNYNLTGRTINEGVNSVGQFFINDATAGAGRLLITTGGLVGVGDYYSPSNLPQNKLSVNGSASIGFSTSGDVAAPTGGLLVNGNVGIGATSPSSKLQVGDSSTLNYTVLGQSSHSMLRLAGVQSPGDRDQITFGFPGTYGAASFGTVVTDAASYQKHDFVWGLRDATTDTAPSERMRLTSAGSLGLATTSPWRTLSVTGTVGFDGLTGATGAGSLCLDSNKQVVYNSASDNCLSSTRATKHDITPLSLDDLGIVDALNPVSFVYNQGDGRVRYGFIAEDTANVDAHLATYDASSTVSGIDDRSILAIVIGAIKDLYARVQEYFARTERLEERVGELEAQLAASAAAGAAATGGSVGAPGGFAAPGEVGADSGTTTPPAENGTSGEPPTSTTSTPETASAPANASTSEGAADVPDAPELEVAQEPPMAEPANDNEVPEPLPATGTDG